MKKFLVPVSWIMRGTVQVEASSEQEAMEKALDAFYAASGYPKDQHYLEDSAQVDGDEDSVIEDYSEKLLVIAQENLLVSDKLSDAEHYDQVVGLWNEYIHSGYFDFDFNEKSMIEFVKSKLPPTI